jgi:DNA-directed RNA polymerase specialized sigma24 family protein
MNNPDILNDEKELYLDWDRSYYPMIRKLVREKTGSESKTEDIFLDSLIVIIEKMRKNELYLTSKMSTYLHGIVENKCKEWLRCRKKENTVTLPDDWEGTEENEYDENIDSSLLKIILHAN